MDSYDIPDKTVTDSMSKDEAGLALNAFDADIQREGLEHPLLKHDHAQHKDVIDYQRRLMERQGVDNRTEEEKVFGGMMERAEQKEAASQEKLRGEADVELAALRKLDFDVDSNMPKEICPYHVEIWRMQRYAAEGKIKELGDMFRNEKGAPRWVSEFLDDPDMPAEEKIELIEARLPRILEYKKAVYEATRAPTMAETKAQMESEQTAQNEADVALVSGRSVAQIEAEIKQLEATPGLFDFGNSGLKFKNPYEYARVIEERDKLYRAAQAARKQAAGGVASGRQWTLDGTYRKR